MNILKENKKSKRDFKFLLSKSFVITYLVIALTLTIFCFTKTTIKLHKEKSILISKVITYNSLVKENLINIRINDSFLNIGGFEEYNIPYDKDRTFQSIPKNFDYEELSIFLKDREAYLSKIPSGFPIKEKVYFRISSIFSKRVNPFTRKVEFHKGIDIVSYRGCPVYAVADGVIEENWIRNRIYGKMIVVKHSFGYQSIYAHLRNSIVREGQTVKKGQLIGYMGNSGLSTGTHLHFQINLNHVAVDPQPYF